MWRSIQNRSRGRCDLVWLDQVWCDDVAISPFPSRRLVAGGEASGLSAPTVALLCVGGLK
jgi:hypothetical protein